MVTEWDSVEATLYRKGTAASKLRTVRTLKVAPAICQDW